jgi:hypothetical protein
MSVLLFAFLHLFEEARVKYDKYVLLNGIRAWLLCERPFRKGGTIDLVVLMSLDKEHYIWIKWYMI